MAPQCTALHLSDEKRCEDEATSLNGLFCSYHSRQCQGLYRGYKNRNKQLDSLNESPPSYLSANSTALANEDFAGVNSEDILHELYEYLFLKYRLLDRVIRARKLHHSRFFALNLDYGHQHYLDTLSNQKFIVARALERLERRVGEVLYEKQKWFKWARQCQLDEETHRESEKKKVKMEAALFKRHMKNVQARMRDLRAKEDLRRQDSYLEEAYKKRMSQEEQEAQWDPIEDVIADERGNYIDLIKHILLMTDPAENDNEQMLQELSINKAAQPESLNTTTSAKSSRKSRGKKQQAATTGAMRTEMPDKSSHDTKSQVRKRLKEGVEVHRAGGLHMLGTSDNPIELKDKTAPFPDDEIDRLLEDMTEIKNLLFCRLLLSHATLLPAALSANSVEEFLSYSEITDTDLRDLALRLDRPGLQEIRDACADLGRGDEDEDIYEDDDSDQDDNPEKDVEKATSVKPRKSRSKVGEAGALTGYRTDKWAPEREKKIQEAKQGRQSLVEQFHSLSGDQDEDSGKTLIDFGNLDDEGKFKSRKMRVKICGRYIYNYPSERAISRGGWLQFCLIAKDSQLHDAIKLCRHWDEFFELNILTIFHYFPAANWLVWKGDQVRTQFLQLGFIPYQHFEGAKQMTVSDQTGSRNQQFRRAHRIMETRNFMCANVKRNDPAMRRFLQYLVTQSSRVVVLIRDAKTGRILTQPPRKEMWLTREKSGLGRASKNAWTTLAEIGPSFFQKMEDTREWHFGFNDYYDIYLWDLKPGQSFDNLHRTIFETLIKAHRFRSAKDILNPAAPTLKTITREPITFRARDIKPGEEISSIWDDTQKQTLYIVDLAGKKVERGLAPDMATKFYHEADMLEDAIIFPEELSTENAKALYRGKVSELEDFAGSHPDWLRWIADLDTDDEIEDAELSGNEHLLENDSEWEDTDEDADDDGVNAANKLTSQHEDKKAAISAEEIIRLLPERVTEDIELLREFTPPCREDPEKEFETFMDREKSKVFKRSWHACEFEPGANEKYREAAIVVKQMAKYQDSFVDNFSFVRILTFLGVHPYRNRRVIPDVCEARAMMALFFPTKFFQSDYGVLHKGTALLDQVARSRDLPKVRSHTSNKYRPASFFEEWDSHWKSHDYYDYPIEWDVAVRPIIAKLYKAGVIKNAYEARPPGRAMAVAEPGRKRDLFIDLRPTIDLAVFPPGVEHPPSTERLLSTARKFAETHTGARFALLRLWEAPHFYPLMVGHDNRWPTSFDDGLDRAWEWNFVPKDMPNSEVSMHHTARLRILPYMHLLGERVFLKRNLYLVMGTSEDDLLKYATATTFVIQTEPWRLEVDLWKSFVNVDMDFLNNLHFQWLE